MASTKTENVTWHGAELDGSAREQALGQRGCVVWFTGLSGSGKSTIARRVEHRLVVGGRFASVLDGDNLRHGLNGDLGFSPADRTENIRRVGHLAQIVADASVVVLAAFVSPTRADRDRVRALLPPGRFFECHVATSLALCEARDPKGLYAKARRGEIRAFTGIDAPYEAPENPEIHLPTDELDVDACAEQVIATLRTAGILIGAEP